MYPSIPNALNRPENHAALEKSMHAAIDDSVVNGVPTIITFSGNRTACPTSKARPTVSTF
jgi:hypothetical protein